MVYLSQTVSLVQPPYQGVIRTSTADYTRYFMKRSVNTVGENTERSRQSGWHLWRWHRGYRKSRVSHQAQNSKFWLKKTVSRCCCARLERIYNRTSQGKKSWKRQWIWEGGGEGDEGFQHMGPVEVQELRDSREINKRQLAGEECFQTSARQSGRRHRRSRARQ